MDIVVGPTGGTDILRRQNLFPDPFATTKWKGPKVGGKVRFTKMNGRTVPVRTKRREQDRADSITGSGGIGGSNDG